MAVPALTPVEVEVLRGDGRAAGAAQANGVAQPKVAEPCVAEPCAVLAVLPCRRSWHGVAEPGVVQARHWVCALVVLAVLPCRRSWHGVAEPGVAQARHWVGALVVLAGLPKLRCWHGVAEPGVAQSRQRVCALVVAAVLPCQRPPAGSNYPAPTGTSCNVSRGWQCRGPSSR